MIIGFAGRIATGKSTMANLLTPVFSKKYEVTTMSFGKHLKECAKLMFNLTDDHLYTLEGKEATIDWLAGGCMENPKTRDILQKMGTEFVRNMIHPNFWVMWLENEISKIKDPSKKQLIFIDDCRFENELYMVRRHGIVIHFTRNTGFLKSDHKSEDTFHYVEGDHVLYLPNDVTHAYDMVHAIIKTELKYREEENAI